MRLSAYVDEAVPRTGATYVLCCALVAEDQHESLRLALTQLKLSRERKIHWHDRLPRDQVRLARSVALLPVACLVVVRLGDATEPTERRRRKCLEYLLWSLNSRGDVGDIIVEARQGKQNEKDRKILDVMRANRTVGPGLRMNHVPGPQEPLLWLPDIFAGAYSSFLAGEPLPSASFASKIEVLIVEG